MDEESPFVAYRSTRVVFPDRVEPATIIVYQGKIAAIKDYSCSRKEIRDATDESNQTREKMLPILDVGDLVIMAGLVDSHVHVNDPGRTEWEGFPTATAAAAAGGVTTIVDMPLNSLPPTTTVSNLKEKLQAAEGRIAVDVAFWGGIVPGNENDLVPLLEVGVPGFKCFLCHSGVDEFPNVTRENLEKAFSMIKGTKGKILFHAEVSCVTITESLEQDPTKYSTFLQSRPGIMELEAIQLVIELCLKYQVPCHIVHLSCADALPLIREAKQRGALLTVETCPHYLTLSAEQVPNGATQFKCCPPIRDEDNRNKLWEGVLDGTIDLIVSDHSPAPATLKCRDTGDFIKAWGGISSLQLALPLIWTEGSKRGLSLNDLTRLLSQNSAKLASLDHFKGALAQGMDADLLIWDPEESVKISTENLLFRHKLSPYLERDLVGKVILTVLRGRIIYSEHNGLVKGYTGRKILLID